MPDPKAPPLVLDESSKIPTLKISEIASVYDIQSITFNAETANNKAAVVTVTRDLKSIPGSTNGVPWEKQAKIGDAYIVITPSGTFGAYYSFMNSQATLVDIGPYTAGTMSGEIAIEKLVFGFDGEGSGFGQLHDTRYEITSDDNKTFIFTAVAPPPNAKFFLVIKATKAS